MKAKLYQQNGSVKGDFDLPDSVFGAEVNDHLMHQVITMLQANMRQGTSKTKGRSEVSGGGRKPWRQKGTGRARAGSNTSPIWVRGGKAHGPDPRDYYSTIPQKMKKGALASALSSRAKDEKVLVVESISCETPKTKVILAMLEALKVSGKRNLLILDNVNSDNAIYLSGRNIKDLDVIRVCEINALDILSNENIIFGDEKLIDKVKEAVIL